MCLLFKFFRPKHVMYFSFPPFVLHALHTWLFVIWSPEQHKARITCFNVTIPTPANNYHHLLNRVKRNADSYMVYSCRVIWRTAAEVKVAVAFWRIVIEAGILMFFLWKGWRIGRSKHEVKPPAFPDSITSSPSELGHPNTKSSTAL